MFVIIVSFSCIHISQGSVKTHLWCDGTYNNQIIENCQQSACTSERITKIGQ